MAADPRHAARQVALQMLYQWEMSGEDLSGVFDSYPRVMASALDEGHLAFAHGLVRGTVSRLADIDPVIDTHTANWRIERLAVLDRLLLRMAVFEMLDRPDTPSVVVINEAMELARTFSGEAAVKFVNGVLDAVRRDLESRART